MADRIKVSPEVLGSPKNLTPTERASVEVLEEYLGMTGCSTCPLDKLCNSNPDFGIASAGVFKHMIIELSQLKRDIQKNNSRRLNNGSDLSVDMERVELWAMVSMEVHPELGFVLGETEAVLECANCPERLDYDVNVVIEYEPES